MSGFPDEPVCWSWPLPTVLTREKEVERLYAEFEAKGPDHYLPRSACRLLTRDWPRYLLSSWHEERCAVCGSRPGRLDLDHDHATGLVRGWLCHGCNVSEGRSYVDQAAAYELYRQRPAAAILGTWFYYVGRGWPDQWWESAALAAELTGNAAWRPAALSS